MNKVQIFQRLLGIAAHLLSHSKSSWLQSFSSERNKRTDEMDGHLRHSTVFKADPSHEQSFSSI